jgi:pimeloyl-ACP methyl ester carboxylesterase
MARESSPPVLGDLPLIVLSRGINASAALHANHAELSRVSRNSRHVIVDGSYHEIHLSHPQVVVASIRDVLDAVRGTTKLAGSP